MTRQLTVHLGQQRVGTLGLDAARRFVFTYAPAWLANAQAVPLSLSLPLRPEPFEDDQARPFFANLLPESELRRIVARRLGLSERNDFALLEAVGGECAGAVSLLPTNAASLAGEGGYRALTPEELDTLIAELPRRPLLAGEQGIRLSLAGAQHKLPVRFAAGHVSLPLGSAASSHILKPPIAHYPHTVENEVYCMALAARAGLPVPEVSIRQGAVPLYLVQRYDRDQGPDGEIRRLHQEDFCQALGVPPDTKYEKEGGPALQTCFDLLRDHSIQPLADLRHLLDWVIFNVLIGNADAHAKNIALLLTRQGPRLAPFYDLLCTAVYPELADRQAMKIGGEDRPDWLIARRWQAFAIETGIGFRLVRQRLTDLATVLPDMADTEAEAFAQQYGPCPILDRIRAIIQQRSRTLIQALAAASS